MQVRSTEIHDEDEVYRYLHYTQVDRNPDQVRKNAFYVNNGPDPELSVDLVRLTPSFLAALVRDSKPNHGVAVIRVADLRHHVGLTIEHDPIPGNIAHCKVMGLSKLNCTALANVSRILRLPISK